ncbi:MAG TPA: hypothetical protein DD379_02850 [Cyanobacteria bacterium UBA11162]|nr:hypothetical protein [Cyanobacteria bacterium UBA11162]
MRSSHLAVLTVAVTLGLVVNLAPPVQAQLSTNSLGSQLPLQWEPPRTPGDSAPVNRESGGIRGPDQQGSLPCIQGEQSLTALVPASGKGTTTAEYPTVFWYMPATTASAVEFVLKDASDRQIYSVTKNLVGSGQGTSTPGIMSLTLPPLANVSPLKTGQTYYWDVSLICDGRDRSADIWVRAEIERILPDSTLASGLEQATPKQRLALYAQHGDWYETLKTLIELRRDLPSDLEVKEAWEKLLRSADLKPMAQSLEGESISQLN